MIEETLGKIETRIKSAESIQPERRAELLRLLETLRDEVSQLSPAHRVQAGNLAGFTPAAEPAVTTATPPLKALDSPAAEFEKAHPQLVRIANAISQQLSNLGI